jgi:hypothetical protein
MMKIEEARAVLDAIREKRPGDIVAPAVASMLIALANYFYDTRKGIAMKGVQGAPDWMGYETSLWKLSEEIRQWLRKQKNLRGSSPLLDACSEIAVDVRFGKGRQNLVLMLGEFGNASYGTVLGTLLLDPEVCGHAVKALVKAKVPGFQSEVEHVLRTAKEPWIRSAAKKYLEVCRS